MDEGEDLEFVATFEVYPEIALPDFSTIKAERLTADVSESDIDEMIEAAQPMPEPELESVEESPVISEIATEESTFESYNAEMEGVESSYLAEYGDLEMEDGADDWSVGESTAEATFDAEWERDWMMSKDMNWAEAAAEMDGNAEAAPEVGPDGFKMEMLEEVEGIGGVEEEGSEHAPATAEEAAEMPYSTYLPFISAAPTLGPSTPMMQQGPFPAAPGMTPYPAMPEMPYSAYMPYVSTPPMLGPASPLMPPPMPYPMAPGMTPYPPVLGPNTPMLPPMPYPSAPGTMPFPGPASPMMPHPGMPNFSPYGILPPMPHWFEGTMYPATGTATPSEDGAYDPYMVGQSSFQALLQRSAAFPYADIYNANGFYGGGQPGMMPPGSMPQNVNPLANLAEMGLTYAAPSDMFAEWDDAAFEAIGVAPRQADILAESMNSGWTWNDIDELSYIGETTMGHLQGHYLDNSPIAGSEFLMTMDVDDFASMGIYSNIAARLQTGLESGMSWEEIEGINGVGPATIEKLQNHVLHEVPGSEVSEEVLMEMMATMNPETQAAMADGSVFDFERLGYGLDVGAGGFGALQMLNGGYNMANGLLGNGDPRAMWTGMGDMAAGYSDVLQGANSLSQLNPALAPYTNRLWGANTMANMTSSGASRFAPGALGMIASAPELMALGYDVNQHGWGSAETTISSYQAGWAGVHNLAVPLSANPYAISASMGMGLGEMTYGGLIHQGNGPTTIAEMMGQSHHIIQETSWGYFRDEMIWGMAHDGRMHDPEANFPNQMAGTFNQILGHGYLWADHYLNGDASMLAERNPAIGGNPN
ncbi:MAG: trigger factor, partial [Bacteroidota bacterium]